MSLTTGRNTRMWPRNTPDKVKELHELMFDEFKKYQVFPLDASVATRMWRVLRQRQPAAGDQSWTLGVQRKQVLSDEVRRVAIGLDEAGREPTLRKAASRLTTPGSMREWDAREVLAQCALN